MVLIELILTVSTLGGFGSLERLILTLSIFGEFSSLEKTELNGYYLERVWWF